MRAAPRIVQVALPCPLHTLFDYLSPDSASAQPVGARVRVPFGARKTLVGVVASQAAASALPPQRLKRVVATLDQDPLWSATLFDLLCWAADYYHHPLGEVLATALPAWLRQGRPARLSGFAFWALNATGQGNDPAVLVRAPAQRRVFTALRAAPDGLSETDLQAISPNWRAALRALQRRGWIVKEERDVFAQPSPVSRPAPPLTPAQAAAVSAIGAHANKYQGFLLHGVTGSGKTEVYLAAIDAVLARGGQALVLVPEIGLTPQLVERFRERFAVSIAVLHSGLTDGERLAAWLAARDGRAAVVLGTRSAVFTPFKRLGLMVVDEEHDGSYKQQEGFRYSARDVAVMRAARESIPVVLGSATPSLESLKNARDGAYQLLELPDRTGGAGMPDVALIDLRQHAVDDGLTHPLRMAIADCLARGEQSLLFLNRRGFAPAWMCHDCGWVANCERCDARLTYHQRRKLLICHHCGHEEPTVTTCPQCADGAPKALGEGTERIEQAIARLFPKVRIARLDRDATRAKGALEETLRRVRAGEADILIGTQMLSKGHDFPNVTLVGVINADQGLYSGDFRAEEKLMQQILQVAGRAGRADKLGRVLLQTWHPDHPLFAALRRHDFNGFADYLLSERSSASYPPYVHLALLRAESPRAGAAVAFLAHAHRLAASPAGVELMDPVPAPMERRQGRWRAQLLVQAEHRKPLHAFLDRWVQALAASKEAKRVRWSLDVDPIDLY